MTCFLDGLTVGSLVLKASGQHHKIARLPGILPFIADVNQFIRSVTAGATPVLPLELEDMKGKAYDFELKFENDRVHLSLGLKTADAGIVLLFKWEGRFGDFCDGFKVF